MSDKKLAKSVLAQLIRDIKPVWYKGVLIHNQQRQDALFCLTKGVVNTWCDIAGYDADWFIKRVKALDESYNKSVLNQSPLLNDLITE